MLTEQIENIERTAYEGVLVPTHAVAIGVVVAVLAAWLLWRERRALGAWTLAFWALRVSAIGLALWMLAGPTHLVIRRVTAPQSVALIVDDSNSMTVSDPAPRADDLRWRLAADDERADTRERIVLLCDRANAHLAEGVTASASLGAAISEHRPTRELLTAAERTRRAAVKATKLLADATELAGTDNGLLAERIDRVLSLLRNAATPALDRIEEATESGEGNDTDTIDNAVAALADALASAERRGRSLAQDVAESAANDAPPASSIVGPTRRDRVNALLAKLDEGVLARLEETCIVHRLKLSEIASSGGAEQNDGAGQGGEGVSTGAVEPRTRVTLVSDTNDDYDGPNADPNADADPPAAVTDLATALREVESLRAAGPLRMALLLTDGRHNAANDATPQEVAARLTATPVYVSPVGASIPVRDVLIHRVEAPQRVVQKDTAKIEVLLTALDCAGEDVEVTLTSDGEVIDRKPLSITQDWQDGRVVFRIDTGKPGFDALGPREYEIEVDAVSDEASLANNLGAVSIEVVRDKLRVLIADNGPRWEYRYLQQLFRRDKHVEFDELLTLPTLRATGRREATGRLPSEVDDWAEYDVVILGDVGPSLLGPAEQESLVEYVQERGGSVIVIAGRQNMPHRHLGTPLIDLLPVQPVDRIARSDGFGVALTDEARLANCVTLRESFRESQTAWREAYTRLPIYGLSRYCRPKPNARVLVEAAPINGSFGVERDDPLAFFSWHPVGAGKVACLGAPQSYTLRFRRGDADHHAFWGQTLRWITAEQASGRDAVRIDTDRSNYPSGQPVEVTVWLRDPQGRPVTEAEVEVEARALDEVAARVALKAEGRATGRYVGTFDRLPVGALEIVPVGDVVEAMLVKRGNDAPRKLISIESSGDIEMLNTQSNRPLLKQIAELTGGRVTPPTAVAELLELASLDPEVTEGTPVRTPLWNRWSYLLAIAGCLMTEWIVRKAKGLT